MLLAISIIRKNRAGDDRRRSDAIRLLNFCFYIVGCQNFQGSVLGRIGHRVRVLSHVEWAVRANALPGIADRLRNGKNVPARERAMQWRPSVSTGSETHHLIGIAKIGTALKIFALELGHVDQHLFW